MIIEKHIEIRFVGSDIYPGNVRSREIAEMITSAEDMIASIIVREHPELKKDNIIIGLTHIQKGSLRLQFAPQLPELVFPAYTKITQSIIESDYVHLPFSSIDSLKKIVAFTRRHSCSAELRINGIDEQLLAMITPETEIASLHLLRGETTIYGQVVRVGGKTKPRAMVETINGQMIFCDVEYELAKKLGQRLYTSVGLSGIAQWHPVNLALEMFSIKEITEYQEIPFSKAIFHLSEMIGEYYGDVEDVEGYVLSIRGYVPEG